MNASCGNTHDRGPGVRPRYVRCFLNAGHTGSHMGTNGATKMRGGRTFFWDHETATITHEVTR